MLLVGFFLEVTFPKLKARSPGSAQAPLTCRLRVMALGWHLVQIPSGQGGCPSHPDLILQLMFSRATNFPLGEERERGEKDEKEEKAAVSSVNAFGAIIHGLCGK